MIEVGSRISEKQKDVLLKTVSHADLAEINEKTSCGYDSIRRIRLRQTPITDKKKKGVEAMVKVAIKNAKKSIRFNQNAVTVLEEMLKKQ